MNDYYYFFIIYFKNIFIKKKNNFNYSENKDRWIVRK